MSSKVLLQAVMMEDTSGAMWDVLGGGRGTLMRAYARDLSWWRRGVRSLR